MTNGPARSSSERQLLSRDTGELDQAEGTAGAKIPGKFKGEKGDWEGWPGTWGQKAEGGGGRSQLRRWLNLVRSLDLILHVKGNL